MHLLDLILLKGKYKGHSSWRGPASWDRLGGRADLHLLKPRCSLGFCRFHWWGSARRPHSSCLCETRAKGSGHSDTAAQFWNAWKKTQIQPFDSRWTMRWFLSVFVTYPRFTGSGSFWSNGITVQSLSLLWLVATSWTAACQAFLSFTISGEFKHWLSL